MDYEQKYEQKYREALGWMRSLYDGLHGATKEDAEHYFPELKENKSERVRKGLIKTISSLLDNTILYHTDITKEEALAWLEKQGEKSTIIDIDKMVMEYSQTKDGDFGLPVDCMIRAYRKGINDALCIALNVEKQGEKKPADNVEPKFKVGNWYQCIKDFFTFDKNTAYYCAKDGFLQNEYGCYIAIIKDLYDNFKLWTIEDAKDGDVLAEDSCIFIIRKLGDNGTAAETYCVLHDDGDFNYDSVLYFDIDSTKPATKEQRDLLFQKIAEAGYEWDSEKKELKKIEPKNPIVNVPPRELILSIWDLGNEWKELTNGCILPEYGTQLDYIQKHWYESEYYLKATQGNKSTEDVK